MTNTDKNRNNELLQTLHGLIRDWEHEIADNTTGRMTFLDIFEVYDGEDRIVMFKIPTAIAGMPTAFKRSCRSKKEL